MSMNLTDNEKSQLRALTTDSKWSVVEHAKELYCAGVLENSPIRETEFETLKAVLANEYKVQGVREFCQRLIEQAHI